MLLSRGILLCVAVCFSWLSSFAAGSDLLPRASRVLFLGDSITYAGRYVEFVETYFATRFPQRNITFLNLGLPSETVSGLSEPGHADGKFPRPDLHERLSRVLAQAHPDTVIACYGMNDGIYMPFSGERFAAFTNGLIWLRRQVSAAGATLIYLTPPVFDEARGKGPGYGTTLDNYSNWILSQRSHGWEVADVHGPMNTWLEERRRTNSSYYLAGDGVHPGEAGHWLMAKALLEHWGAKDLKGAGDAKAMMAGYPKGEMILKLVESKQRLLKDSWLTATGHKRPGMNRGAPLAEAQSKAAELDKRIRALAAH